MDKPLLIIQNFTNFKKNKKFHEIELLIWTANLVKFRSFGYKIKLYCTPEAVPFLQEWHLFELYDEIDDSYLNKEDSILKQVDEEHFWSSRKLEAIYHELVELKTECPVVYTDVDLIMLKPFELDNFDCFFWSPEEWTEQEGDVYVDWDILSVPEGYEMPQYIKENHKAYNCGIICFKDPKNFLKYREQYYAFALNNPCKFIPIPDNLYSFEKLNEQNNVWACNAEQRILFSVVDNLKLNAGCVMSGKLDGRCPNGCHYFVYRICWKELDTYLLPPRGWVDVLMRRSS